MVKVGVIVGSTRPNRIGLEVAARAGGREYFELVDVADFDLPLMDEPLPPSLGQYTKDHSKRLAPAKPKQIDTKNLSGPEITMPKRKRLVMIEIPSSPAHHQHAPVARRLADSRMHE